MIPTDWITPAQLAAQMGRPERWVTERMADGTLPSVKVGKFRYWTPGCLAELERRQGVNTTADQEASWGRKGRRAS